MTDLKFSRASFAYLLNLKAPTKHAPSAGLQPTWNESLLGCFYNYTKSPRRLINQDNRKQVQKDTVYCLLSGNNKEKGSGVTFRRQLWFINLALTLRNLHVISQSVWRLGYGLGDRCSRIRFPARVGNFSLHHRVQNGFGTHPASYPMGTRSSFPGGKAARAWIWQLTSI
jgi:hypothetical protein